MCAKKLSARKLLEDPSCVGKKIIYLKPNSEVKDAAKKQKNKTELKIQEMERGPPG